MGFFKPRKWFKRIRQALLPNSNSSTTPPNETDDSQNDSATAVFGMDSLNLSIERISTNGTRVAVVRPSVRPPSPPATRVRPIFSPPFPPRHTSLLRFRSPQPPSPFPHVTPPPISARFSSVVYMRPVQPPPPVPLSREDLVNQRQSDQSRNVGKLTNEKKLMEKLDEVKKKAEKEKLKKDSELAKTFENRRAAVFINPIESRNAEKPIKEQRKTEYVRPLMKEVKDRPATTPISNANEPSTSQIGSNGQLSGTMSLLDRELAKAIAKRQTVVFIDPIESRNAEKPGKEQRKTENVRPLLKKVKDRHATAPTPDVNEPSTSEESELARAFAKRQTAVFIDPIELRNAKKPDGEQRKTEYVKPMLKEVKDRSAKSTVSDANEASTSKDSELAKAFAKRQTAVFVDPIESRNAKKPDGEKRIMGLTGNVHPLLKEFDDRLAERSASNVNGPSTSKVENNQQLARENNDETGSAVSGIAGNPNGIMIEFFERLAQRWGTVDRFSDAYQPTSSNTNTPSNARTDNESRMQLDTGSESKTVREKHSEHSVGNRLDTENHDGPSNDDGNNEHLDKDTVDNPEIGNENVLEEDVEEESDPGDHQLLDEDNDEEK